MIGKTLVVSLLCVILASLCSSCLPEGPSGDSTGLVAVHGAQADPNIHIASTSRSSLPYLRGVNLGGSQGLDRSNPKFLIYKQGYIYSPPQDYAYFARKGMNFVRVPVVWERLQHAFDAPFDADELARIDDVVRNAMATDMYVAIDIHNFGRFDGAIVNDPPGLKAFGRLWSMLAARYQSDPHVLFEPMNEPHTMQTGDVQALMQTAIDAIRSQGATNPILIDGNAFSGAHSWLQAGNASLLQLKDPSNHLIFDTHQYLDKNATGRFTDCIGPQQIVQAVTPVTAWARTHGQRLLLGEFSAADTGDCHASIDALLSFIDANKDVWAGWSWWEANPYDPVSPSHFYGVEPTIDKDGAVSKEVPQLAWLVSHLKD